MGRKKETVKKKINEYVADRDILDPLDFTKLNEITGDISSTEIIIRNENGSGSKVPLTKITDPINDRIDSIEEELARKADKCFTIAMSLVLG